MNNLRFLLLMVTEGVPTIAGTATAEIGVMAAEASGSVTPESQSTAESTRSDAEPIFIGVPSIKKRRVVREKAIGRCAPLRGFATTQLRAKSRRHQRAAATSSATERHRVFFPGQCYGRTGTREQFALRESLAGRITTDAIATCAIPTTEAAAAALRKPAGLAAGHQNQRSANRDYHRSRGSLRESRSVTEGRSITTIMAERYRVEGRLPQVTIPIVVRKTGEIAINRHFSLVRLTDH